MSKHILILAGDGIGPEIVKAAEQVLTRVNDQFNLGLTWEQGLLGGAAIDAHGSPYPDVTAAQAKNADAILLGAVGGPKWDNIERSIRPERGLLKIRSELNLFANLRPAILYPQLADASSLKPEIVAGLDILIVRELTGGIYFGQPRGFVNLRMVKNKVLTPTFMLSLKLSVLRKWLLKWLVYVVAKSVRLIKPTSLK